MNLISNLNRPAGLIRNLISYLDVNDANNVSDIFAYFVRHMKLISFMFKQGEVGLGQCDLIWQNLLRWLIFKVFDYLFQGNVVFDKILNLFGNYLPLGEL